MPRQHRFRLPGIPQHVVSRGNDRHACFFDESDYRSYLALLGESAEKQICSIHAIVLMTNQVHLVVTPNTTDGVSRMMQSVSRRYVQRVIGKYGQIAAPRS